MSWIIQDKTLPKDLKSFEGPPNIKIIHKACFSNLADKHLVAIKKIVEIKQYNVLPSNIHLSKIYEQFFKIIFWDLFDGFKSCPPPDCLLDF